MLRSVFIAVIFLLACLLQHIIHEAAHMAVARGVGVRVKKVHWFTYSKWFGSRVYYENEPDPNLPRFERHWGWIAAAGTLVTMTIGLIVTGLFQLAQSSGNMGATLILCLVAIPFLLFDSLYLLLGSILGFGDIVGIRKAFQIPGWAAAAGCVLLFATNVTICRLILWG